MTIYYFDSSAIIKRYVVEPGTSWVRAIAAPTSGNRIYLAAITVVEVTAAIARRRRGKSLSPADATSLFHQFGTDLLNAYRILEITPVLLKDAADCADRYELRGYDAVQLSAALTLQKLRVAASLSPVVFVSADGELNAAATAAGLAVEDPNAHP